MRSRSAVAVVVAVAAVALILYFGLPRVGSNHADNAIPMASSTLSLRVIGFDNGGVIPAKYTCDGDGALSPALEFSGVPLAAKSLALIVDDPDVPKQVKPDGLFVHWVLFNIPPATAGIAEGSSAGTPGANGAGQHAYTGPCPPPQYEPSEHRYVFKLYALDVTLALSAGATKDDVEQAMAGHVVAEAQYVGRYKRP